MKHQLETYLLTSIYPNMDSSILLNSFIVVIVGGIGSILGYLLPL